METIPEVWLRGPMPGIQPPSTTLGLIFHAAEHSARHAGQIVTLASVVRG